ncbi:MATE family efflux transporter [Streptomyces stelliscabiei]|uniref:Probable multidrug resistance protein NorM n=1 Tax=Streptomyces stelliscabiei TaxID=146820 RepID=A0A8I0PFD0_9ACTN|nr:MATE family efflux transporter [Streptomyces stelliscabiei]KND43000.1 multidrug transporter [Streptomyces stelliscabiei]MBE1602529.1 MATE family multidrug resistance protein [Streptomyces stelliscabiei]MDX2516749.1 MATE family efflux transporter [Streptomyces stelliscabiei]MDX2550495.1 MATE family efflux transporter [Streptomyces stelliscabiei]MDX2610193.1 MATE family efflux transporter [Streptomyces stelliscabiei]
MPPALTRLLTDSRALATLAVPLALTQLAQVALTTTDTIMMGLLGTEALAAGGLALVIFNQLRTMGVGLVTAVGNQVAAADARAESRDTETDGAGAEAAHATRAAHEEVRDLVRASLLLSTLAGLAGALLMVGIGHAVVFLGQDPDVVDTAKPVLYALAPGLLPCLWFQAIRQFTVGMRRPQALLRITLASIAVNAGLNWAFIHGTWGLPKLGLPGIGLATTSVYALSFLALYLSARRDPRLAPVLSLSIWKTRPATLRRLTGLGAPIAATYGSEAGFFSVVALLVGSFGTAALAAHTAVNQLVYIVFQIAVGLSHAASLGVSRELALGNTAAAQRLKSTALACAAAVMAVVALLYVAVPGLVLAPFFEGESRTATDLATSLLLIAAVMQFFDCAQNIGVGLLRGLDDTKGGFRITLVGYWLVGLPAALLLGFTTGWDTTGIWLGLLTGLATTALLLLRRFNRGVRLRDTTAALATP